MLLFKLIIVVLAAQLGCPLPVNQERSSSAPSDDSASKKIGVDFLGDQPVETTDSLNQWMEKFNQSEIDYMRTLRVRRDNSKSKSDDRTKDNWLQVLKDNILRQVGRSNATLPKINDKVNVSTWNISQIFLGPIPADAMIDEDFIAEKIRSYYPSCEVPKNTDHDLWKDENTMNLYFNVDYHESSNAGIAAAMLRLYRTPPANTSSDDSCENTSEEQLLRVSIYWYTKSLKKQRVKRRLSDSKVVAENSKWVELSVLPATKAWSKGKNLGMAVIVEDQEGNVLKADKYFKGASCMVGTCECALTTNLTLKFVELTLNPIRLSSAETIESQPTKPNFVTATPKPIPTAFVDSKFWANALEQSSGNLGGSASAALYSNILLLPTIDICTVELPLNATLNPNGYRNACDFKRIQNQIQRQTQEGAQQSSRHIRHQKQHLHNDPNKRVVITKEQIRSLTSRMENATQTNAKR